MRNKNKEKKIVFLYNTLFIFTLSRTRMKNVIVFYVKSTGKQLNALASVRICEGRGGGRGRKVKDDTSANCNEANRLATI